MLGLAVMLASATFAYPSLLGPNGGATLPTAATTAQGQFNIAVNYQFNGETMTYEYEGITETDDVSDMLNIALLYGIAPNFEVGANYNNQSVDWTATDGYDTISGDEGMSNWGLNAKYAFNDVFAGTNVAVGGVYQSFEMNDMNVWQVYGVATKAFMEAGEGATGVSGSLGLNYTSFDRDNDENNNATRLFAGLDVAFANNLSLLAEYQTKKSDFEDKAMTSIALRYPFTPSLTAQVAFTNSYRGLAGAEDNDLMLGLNYAFGGAAE